MDLTGESSRGGRLGRGRFAQAGDVPLVFVRDPRGQIDGPEVRILRGAPCGFDDPWLAARPRNRVGSPLGV